MAKAKPKKRSTNVYGEEVTPLEPAIEVKRFKTEDGREGSYAPIGHGLIKVLFDDGSMVIARELGTDKSKDSSEDIPY
jgi:hypothetical protein